ncbi:MAG: hypothetical protein JSR36_17920 [Proteobacteria bacterium]|nr:hypothetical protein [Pseudomonadota bacterium]
MKVSTWVVATAALLAVGLSQATVAQASNSQQEKMASCNAEAKTKALSGDARKQFMSDCLSAHPAAKSTGNSQQEKMKACNAEAKLKAPSGEAHKQFMSECLKGGSTAAGGTDGGPNKK